MWAICYQRRSTSLFVGRVSSSLTAKLTGVPDSLIRLLEHISHCADAVLSLANLTTLVGFVSQAITEFAARWVQTPSGYDYLIATSMRTEWIHEHQPVISRHETGHHVYSKFSHERPEGKWIQCRSCPHQIIGSRPKGNQLIILCPSCKSTALIDKWENERGTILYAHGIVKAPFPPGELNVSWRSPPPKKPQVNGPHQLTQPGNASVHLPPQLARPVSSPEPAFTPRPFSSSTPSSTSLRIVVPSLASITRMRSTPEMRDNSATPSDRKRLMVGDTHPAAQKKLKRRL